MNSLLLLWVCGSTVVIMVAAALVLFALARTYQIKQLDRRVKERARLLSSMIELDNSSIELDFEELDLTEFETPAGGWYLEVWFDGESIYRSPSLGEAGLDLDRFAPHSAIGKWFELPTSPRCRGIMLRFDLGDQLQSSLGQSAQTSTIAVTNQRSPKIFVFVARDAADVLAALRHLALGLTIVTGAAILVMALTLTRVVDRSMRPVDELAVMIEQIHATDLDSKIELTTLPRELEPIVHQFNALMSRLQIAFERERGFCADIAHELRTPLAGLRTTLDVAKARERSQQDYARAIDQCHQVVLQTQDLIEALLQIAKLESGQIDVHPEAIDVNAEIQRIWQDVTERTTTDKNYQLNLSLSANQPIWADPAILEIILRNLFHNALDYVNDDGVIEVESLSSPSDTTMTISNSGSQVATENTDKVFDRFWRGSESRSGTGSHFGLGLSLAQRAAENAGGTLSVESERNGMFRAIFRHSHKSRTESRT